MLNGIDTTKVTLIHDDDFQYLQLLIDNGVEIEALKNALSYQLKLIQRGKLSPLIAAFINAVKEIN